MKTNIYYVGMYKRNKTIVFQIVQNKDSLNCELLEYYGMRQKNKKDIAKELKINKNVVISELKKQFKTLTNCTKLSIE